MRVDAAAANTEANPAFLRQARNILIPRVLLLNDPLNTSADTRTPAGPPFQEGFGRIFLDASTGERLFCIQRVWQAGDSSMSEWNSAYCAANSGHPQFTGRRQRAP